jgi:CDP-diglyceride synthetase
MNTPLVAGIVGTVVATIVCAFMARYLHRLQSELSVGPYMLVIAAILAVIFATAHWMDKRDAARKARGRSDRT